MANVIITVSISLACGILSGIIANLLTSRIVGRDLSKTFKRWLIVSHEIVALVTVVLVYAALTIWVWDPRMEIAAIVISVVLLVIVPGGIGSRVKGMVGFPHTFLVLLLSVLVVVVLHESAPHYVVVSNPGSVWHSSTIRGRTLYEADYVSVFVRPHQTNIFFYEGTATPDGRGQWALLCYFGGDEGERFDVLAVSTPGKVEFSQDQFEDLEGALPKGSRKSAMVTVRKGE